MRCTGYVAGVAALASLGCATEGVRRVVITQETRVSVAAREPAPDDVAPVRRGTVTLFPAIPDRLDPQTFHRVLDERGEWSDHPTVGPVSTPTSARGTAFVPYVSRGRWVYTRDGWYWQSDDPWGAVTFHYGRWLVHNEAWSWAPGDTFAPAWVDWRAGAGWVGWSPRAPDGLDAQSPFVYCAHDRLAGAGLWSRVVQGPAAVSLFAPTAPLDPSRGYDGALYGFGPPPPPLTAAPSAQNVWASSLPPDTDFAPAAARVAAAVDPRPLRQTLTLGYSSEIRAARAAGSARVACAACGPATAPVHMPPAADAMSGASLAVGGGWRSYGRGGALPGAAYGSPMAMAGNAGAPSYAVQAAAPTQVYAPAYGPSTMGGGAGGPASVRVGGSVGLVAR